MVAAAGPSRLQTERLVLRPWRIEEAAVHRQLWTERDPRVPAHRRLDDQGRPSVDDIAGWIARDDGTSTHRLLAVQRRAEGDVIGYCGLLLGGNGSEQEPELAYELLRRAHGAGYATEAARAVVGWADRAGYRRLWAGVREWNHASSNVLAKLGFVPSGRVEPDAAHGDSLLLVRQAPPRSGT